MERSNGIRPSLDEVIARAISDARQELLNDAGARAEDLQHALDKASGRYLSAARELSRRRRESAGPFAREVEALLAELAMARTRFEVRFNAVELGPEEWGDAGIDRGEFYVSPNPGEELRPLARIVSGCELSARDAGAENDGRGQRSGKSSSYEVDAGIAVASPTSSVWAARAREGSRCCAYASACNCRPSDNALPNRKECMGGRTLTSVES